MVIKREPVECKDPKTITWQSCDLGNAICDIGLKKECYDYPLPEGIEDTTKDDYKIAQMFEPDIKLVRDIKRDIWHGRYYRVLKNKTSKKEGEDERCIQWLYVWNQQEFTFSIRLLFAPIFLGSLGILMPYLITVTQARWWVIVAILLGFISTGIFRYFHARISADRADAHNTLAYIFFGLLAFAVYGSELRWIPRFPLISIIVFLVIFSLIFYSASKKLWGINYAAHPMDWEPLFIYVNKNNITGEWELNKVIYDAFHYYSAIKKKEDLQKWWISSLSDEKHVQFDIANFWHSFEPRGIGRKLIYLSIIIAGVILFMGVLLRIISQKLNRTLQILPYMTRGEYVHFIIFIILAIVILVLLFYLFDRIIVSDSHYPPINWKSNEFRLRKEQLLIFWNLNHKKAKFKIIEKLQNPFIEDEKFSTFTETKEDLTRLEKILIAILLRR